MSQTLVHVIDDDGAVRESLAFLLATAGHPAVAHDSAAAFLKIAAEARGCVVTDVRMPDMDGLELIKRLKARAIDLPVIVITGHADVPLAVEAMKVGAIDFIEKPFAEETILAAVARALEKQANHQERDGERASAARRLATLSAREREVMEGLVAGKANKVIAHDLGISPRTVEIYRAHVMTKSRAASLSELVRIALNAGVA